MHRSYRKLPYTLAIFLAFLFSVQLAAAQTAARIISGFPPGGGVDVVARLLADSLSRQTGKPYIVETKTGAGGAIAIQSLLAAPRDGTALLIAPDSNIVIYPHTVAAPGYAITDFAPISTVAAYDLAFTVKADGAVPDLKSFVNRAKADPRSATFASPGAGGLQHFYGLAVAQAIGVELMHVPYRGVAPAIADTIGGVVGAAVTPVGPVLRHAEAGSLRILATSGEHRGAGTPNIPSFKELGYPQLNVRGWFGLFAPAGTPAETVQRINELVGKALQSPDFKEKLAAIDMEPRWVPSIDFAAQLASENKQWAQLVKKSGFTAEK